MKIIIATAIVVATQIGCTWWLSKQEPWDTFRTSLQTETAVRRIECDLNEQKHMLFAHWAQQPLDTKWLTNTLCDAITLPGIN